MEHLHLLPPTVADLDLSRCDLGDVGIKVLCEFIKTNMSITRLMLWGNAIGDDGAKHIGAMLKVNTTLQHLDIAKHHEPDERDILAVGITTKGWSYIAKALKMNRTLRKLSFGSSLFQNRYMLTLGSGLKNNIEGDRYQQHGPL
jgi:Ran GTPase-activating protein (RanGAP) involved in mRNA processing and transport